MFEYLRPAVRSMLFSVLTFLMAACAHEPPSAQNPVVRSEAAYRYPSAYRAGAGTVEKRVAALLEMAGLSGVTASVNEETGYVHLSGRVPDASTRNALITAVGSLRGVHSVDESLFVEAPPAASQDIAAAEPGFAERAAEAWPYPLAILVAAFAAVWVHRRTGKNAPSRSHRRASAAST
jgi:hypothetical protein